MNYHLIVQSTEIHDGRHATESHIFAMYCDELAISHSERWTECHRFVTPDGNSCGAISVTLNELETMRLVKVWHPAQETQDWCI